MVTKDMDGNLVCPHCWGVVAQLPTPSGEYTHECKECGRKFLPPQIDHRSYQSKQKKTGKAKH